MTFAKELEPAEKKKNMTLQKQIPARHSEESVTVKHFEKGNLNWGNDIQVVARMMKSDHQHHSDLATAFALTEKEWEGRCQQWHMYKRDLAIGNYFSTVPSPGVRYETVCIYLETLLRKEVTETACRQLTDRNMNAGYNRILTNAPIANSDTTVMPRCYCSMERYDIVCRSKPSCEGKWPHLSRQKDDQYGCHHDH